MWKLVLVPIVFGSLWVVSRYPEKVFGTIDKIDAKLKEWAVWILK